MSLLGLATRLSRGGFMMAEATKEIEENSWSDKDSYC